MLKGKFENFYEIHYFWKAWLAKWLKCLPLALVIYYAHDFQWYSSQTHDMYFIIIMHVVLCYATIFSITCIKEDDVWSSVFQRRSDKDFIPILNFMVQLYYVGSLFNLND